jgi:mono/diheme cytochrome c family protein
MLMREKSMTGTPLAAALASLMLVGALACGGEAREREDEEAAETEETEHGLSAEELELGIGPVKHVELGELDAAMAATGEAVFNLKCAACHKLTDRYVGPPLGQVLERRKPEYVMNMILNPAEMLEKHPAAKEMLAQFMTPMPNQNLTETEARAVLEYLRSAASEGSNER